MTLQDILQLQARRSLQREQNSAVPDERWIAVYVKRILCEHEHAYHKYNQAVCDDCGAHHPMNIRK